MRCEASSDVRSTWPSDAFSAASSKHTNQRPPETATIAKPCASGRCQLISPPRVVTSATNQPVPFAAMEHIMEDHLAGGLPAQDPDVPRSAAGAKHAAMHRVQDRKLHRS
jgi:hypothetical protein